MGEKSVKLSIILVSFNTREITCQCLKSLYAAEWDFPFEIIMVDNNSHDDTLEHVRRDFPEVKIIANEDNKLFAIANNQGAAIANGEYLLLLNTDTIAEGDNLCRLVHYMEGLPEKVVCLGPKVLNADGSLQSCGHAMGVWASLAVSLLLHKLLPDSLVLRLLPAGVPLRKEAVREVGWVMGCCMLMRASYYHTSGGLNENLVFYGEEEEFSWRAHRAQKEVWYYPYAHIIHLGRASTTDKVWVVGVHQNTQVLIARLTSGIPLAILSWIVLLCVNIVKFLFTFRPKYWKLIKRASFFICLFLKSIRPSDFIPGNKSL